MPTYKVIWQESHEATIQAESKEEAREMALNGEIEAETSELASGEVEVYEMKG